jgi:hypothetical protein
MWSFAHESIFGPAPAAAAASDDVLDPSHQVAPPIGKNEALNSSRNHQLPFLTPPPSPPLPSPPHPHTLPPLSYLRAQFDESAIDSACVRKLERLQQIIVEQVRYFSWLFVVWGCVRHERRVVMALHLLLFLSLDQALIVFAATRD